MGKKQTNAKLPVVTKRRRRVVPISPQMLADMFVTGNRITAEIVEGLPEGVKALGTTYDGVTLYLHVEHESYDEIEEGDTIPYELVSVEEIRLEDA